MFISLSSTIQQRNISIFLCCLYLSTVRSPGPAASQQTSQLEQELAEVKDHLHTVEEQNSEQAEQLKNAKANVDQYRAMVLTLEDSLKKEKEVNKVSHWTLLTF